MKIGEQVREYQDKAMLTQEELGKKAGLSGYTISRIESDQVAPRVSTIRKIAGALGIEPEELTARPKAKEAVSLEQWLEDRCGHAYLAMSFDELRQFIKDAEDLDEQFQRRQLLREEIDVVWAERTKFPATEQRNIGNVPFEQIHTRWIRTLFVAVKLRIVTPEQAEREAQELVLA